MYQARGFQLNLEPSQGARTHTLWQIWDAAVCTVISVFFNKIFPTQILTHTHTRHPKLSQLNMEPPPQTTTVEGESLDNMS